MKLKATAGQIDKHNVITQLFPNQDTITSTELKTIKTLLSADGKTSLAYYITDNFGTGRRGVYHLPKLVNGHFVVADDIVTTPTGKKPVSYTHLTLPTTPYV